MLKQAGWGTSPIPDLQLCQLPQPGQVETREEHCAMVQKAMKSILQGV